MMDVHKIQNRRTINKDYLMFIACTLVAVTFPDTNLAKPDKIWAMSWDYGTFRPP